MIFDTRQSNPSLEVRHHPCHPTPPRRATEILAALSRCARGSVHAELAVGMAKTTSLPWKTKAMPMPHCSLMNTGLFETTAYRVYIIYSFIYLLSVYCLFNCMFAFIFLFIVLDLRSVFKNKFTVICLFKTINFNAQS